VSVTTAVIADDEPLARRKLGSMLAKDPEIHVLERCRSARETISAVRTHRPDLLFLDIRMPDGDGFSVLEEIKGSQGPLVVMTTAFDDYAVRAFEEQALDYLLKPFDMERLTRALQKAKVEAARRRAARGIPEKGTRIPFKAGGRVVFLEPLEIDWVLAARNYVRLSVQGASYLVRGSLKEIGDLLQGRGPFLQIHRSVIVNSARIREVSACNSGEFIVKLESGKELPASRSYRDTLKLLCARDR
jgi:two-component system LytT family response regulator